MLLLVNRLHCAELMVLVSLTDNCPVSCHTAVSLFGLTSTVCCKLAECSPLACVVYSAPAFAAFTNRPAISAWLVGTSSCCTFDTTSLLSSLLIKKLITILDFERRPFFSINCVSRSFMCRLRGARVCGEWEQLSLQCLLAFVSASHYAQGFMQSRDQEHNGLLVSSLCHPATLLPTNLIQTAAAVHATDCSMFACTACIDSQLAVWLGCVCQVCQSSPAAMINPYVYTAAIPRPCSVAKAADSLIPCSIIALILSGTSSCPGMP